MNLPEFREICEDVFGKDKHGKAKGFPSGCDDCQSELEWDCRHVDQDGNDVLCHWRENYWKYDEIKRFISLAKAQKGGMNLNRFSKMALLDFIKVAIINEFI